MNTSGWVKEAHMECPWQIKTSERTQCGFLRWYQALSESNDDWNASRVLIAVLKILPSLSPWDQKVVFAAYCFGTYKPDDPSLHPSPLSENETITGFVVSLSRAQALMDLALILRLRYPDGFQHGEPFTDWYLSYIAALKYHSLASKFLASIQHNEEVNMHRVRFAIQDTRLADFLRVEFQSTHSELEQLPIRMRIFPEWIVPLLLSSDAKSTPDAVKLRDCKFDLLKLLNIQLHENEDMVGYLETCALLYTAAPRIPDSPTSINNDDQDDGSPLFQVKFDTLVLQTLDVALWLKGTEPIEKFNRLILDTSSGIVPLESTQDATVENSTLKEENKKPEALDIPLHLLFLNVFRGTSPEALYDLDPGFLPSPISHIEIETTAGVIRDIFEAELESTDPLGRLSFLTNEIPTPAEGGEFRFTLLSSMSRGTSDLYALTIFNPNSSMDRATLKGLEAEVLTLDTQI